MSREIYQIISDSDELDAFIDWLPECEPFEQFYVALFSRKKYAPNHPACTYDKTQLKRFTATKDTLYDKLCQLETPMFTYKGAEGLSVPQEALAVYISINPRDLYKAHLRGIGALAEQLEKHTPETIGNPHQEIMNVIQTTAGKTRYRMFDIDDNLIEKDALIEKIKPIIGEKFTLIQTKGGYHLAVPVDAAWQFPMQKSWFLELKKLSDVVNDCLIPIPGTFQGNFCPRVIYHED